MKRIKILCSIVFDLASSNQPQFAREAEANFKKYEELTSQKP